MRVGALLELRKIHVDVEPAVVAFGLGMNILHGCICRYYQPLEGKDGHVGGIHVFTDTQLLREEGGGRGQGGVGGDGDGGEVRGVAHAAVIVHEDTGTECLC